MLNKVNLREEVSVLQVGEDNLNLRSLDELFSIVLCKLGKVELRDFSFTDVGIEKVLAPGDTRAGSTEGSRVLVEFVELATRLS